MRKFGGYIASLILALVALFSGCASEEVPKPQTKEGRFNFTVTYEVNGEEQTLSGVYVCKFIKATASLNGWWREWKGYIEDGKVEEEFTILTDEDGRIDLELGLDPMYFMSDPFCDGISEPQACIYYNEQKREEMGEYCSYDVEILESYGVKIISWDYDEPIENVYE